jgi:hypothetical protein
MTTDDIFLDTFRIYWPLVDKLVDLYRNPCPITGEVTRDQIVRVLGEEGGIWPKDIYADAVIARLEEVARRYS